MMQHASGLTLIELLATLTVAGILTAYAVPAFNDLLDSNRTTTFVNDFVTHLQLARTEAIKRGQPVSVCAASSSALTSCGSNTSWSNGWIVFVDSDSNGVIAASSDRLKLRQALESNRSVTSANGVITYSSAGFVTSGSGTYQLQLTGCTGNKARLISINSSGRINVSTTTCSS